MLKFGKKIYEFKFTNRSDKKWFLGINLKLNESNFQVHAAHLLGLQKFRVCENIYLKIKHIPARFALITSEFFHTHKICWFWFNVLFILFTTYCLNSQPKNWWSGKFEFYFQFFLFQINWQPMLRPKKNKSDDTSTKLKSTYFLPKLSKFTLNWSNKHVYQKIRINFWKFSCGNASFWGLFYRGRETSDALEFFSKKVAV